MENSETLIDCSLRLMRPHRHREVNHVDFIRAYLYPSFLWLGLGSRNFQSFAFAFALDLLRRKKNIQDERKYIKSYYSNSLIF